MQLDLAGEEATAEISRLDLLFAALLHLLVFVIITVLSYWQQHRSEPLQRIEVLMISAQELAKMQQQARAQPEKRSRTAARPEKAEKPKPKPKPEVKPVARPKPKPKARPAPRPKPVEDNFDPFAPMASPTDRRSRSRTTAKNPTEALQAKTTRPELADIAGQQLSRNEIERYIAMMQAAVQEQWKVPASLGNVRDPLVEMRLHSDGRVESVTILESSGSDLLDASLERAIHAAAPFQLPRKQFEFFRVNRLRFHPIK